MRGESHAAPGHPSTDGRARRSARSPGLRLRREGPTDPGLRVTQVMWTTCGTARRNGFGRSGENGDDEVTAGNRGRPETTEDAPRRTRRRSLPRERTTPPRTERARESVVRRARESRRGRPGRPARGTRTDAERSVGDRRWRPRAQAGLPAGAAVGGDDPRMAPSQSIEAGSGEQPCHRTARAQAGAHRRWSARSNRTSRPPARRG
jgi:hypothetical protein